MERDTLQIIIFKDLNQAVKFVDTFKYNENIKIYECEVQNPAELHRRASIFSSIDMEDLWKNWLDEIDTYAVPEGTYGCDAIKLLRKVYDKKK
jgi:hypothetical protein